MRKVSALIGFSLGLLASIGIVLWTGAPRRVNYAFVGDDSQYSEFLGMPGLMAALGRRFAGSGCSPRLRCRRADVEGARVTRIPREVARTA